MAFGYRKRSPGSGGSRPGAGRRPDFKPALRKDIGEFCERAYRSECARYNYTEWLFQIVEIWDQKGASQAERGDILFEIQQNLETTLAARQIIARLVQEPGTLYSESGELDFDIEPMISTLEVVAGYFLGISLPVPHGRALPRKLIVATKQKVIRQAKLRIAPSGDFSEISDGIIKACWRYQQLLLKSTEIHTINRPVDN